MLLPKAAARPVVWLVGTEVSLPAGWGWGVLGAEHGAAAQSTARHVPPPAEFISGIVRFLTEPAILISEPVFQAGTRDALSPVAAASLKGFRCFSPPLPLISHSGFSNQNKRMFHLMRMPLVFRKHYFYCMIEKKKEFLGGPVLKAGVTDCC